MVKEKKKIHHKTLQSLFALKKQIQIILVGNILNYVFISTNKMIGC